MTLIDRVGPLPPVRPGGRVGAVGSSVFPLPADPAADAARTAGVATAAAVSLDSLLTLQQVDEPTERDRAARRRGQALLGALGRLQLLLLVEGDPVPTLAQLRSLAEGAPAAADPALAAAIDQVVLRARIELARRGG
jgi:hypothetical protein